MDYKEALEYINGVSWLGSRPGLERVKELLEKLGRPQDGLKFIHIAGTNGKGSCAALLASVMKCCGYKTGLFTSPYLYRFNERMQINGKQINGYADYFLSLFGSESGETVEITVYRNGRYVVLDTVLVEQGDDTAGWIIR